LVWSLPCLVIGYTSIAHGKICVHNMLNYFFSNPLALRGLILFISNPNGGLPCERLPQPIEHPKVKMIGE
jgi:hypothetical protein